MGKRWLLKSEPEVYPFAKLVQDERTTWDGVRNPQARNNLAAMSVGDLVFFYHSHDTEVVGIAKVTKTAFPDPTADDPRWLAVELAAVEPLPAPVSLEAIKADKALRELQLVTHSRLSVMPVDAAQWARIEALSRDAARVPRSGKAPPAAASSRSSAGSRRSGRPVPRP
jgi:predicted RNA-binding protein with PUA-like domain